MGVITEDIKSMMDMLMDKAKEIRSSYKFSEDEKMTPVAFINANELIVVGMHWADDKEKYALTAMISMKARTEKATSLSLVTDGRTVRRDEFMRHFAIPENLDVATYKSRYFQILREHGGQLKNLPRHLWHDILIVMTNGPKIPLTMQTQSYVEGDNDTVKYIDKPIIGDTYKSDLLTDWWS